MENKLALLSVADKTAIVELAQFLERKNYRIVSTGGTARLLRQGELAHLQEISELTGFPEILEGRVKTLHPKVFGGILAKLHQEAHREELSRYGIEPIALVVVNLYPFREMLTQGGLTTEELLEYIDIGGVSLLRAAAKNYSDVAVVCDPADYALIAEEIEKFGEVTLASRKQLAAKAFSYTAYYDAVIANYFREQLGEVAFPHYLALGLEKVDELRYGENPHQRGVLYRLVKGRDWGLVTAEKLQGKELSFNNYLDLDAAWETVGEFTEPTCVIVKHTNPCGIASGERLGETFRLALATNPVSAFGGVVAFNREVDGEVAREMAEHFFECVVAPGFTEEARETFRQKQNLRLLVPRSQLLSVAEWDYKSLSGGLLIQDKDNQIGDQQLQNVTKRETTLSELTALHFAWRAVKHLKSNAIVLATTHQTLGLAAGQTSRINAVRIAGEEMRRYFPLINPDITLVLASDGFFPFRDNIDEAKRLGVSAVIQPGGSRRDEEVIAASNEYGLAMVFTGMRHFKH